MIHIRNLLEPSIFVFSRRRPFEERVQLRLPDGKGVFFTALGMKEGEELALRKKLAALGHGRAAEEKLASLQMKQHSHKSGGSSSGGGGVGGLTLFGHSNDNLAEYARAEHEAK